MQFLSPERLATTEHMEPLYLPSAANQRYVSIDQIPGASARHQHTATSRAKANSFNRKKIQLQHERGFHAGNLQ